MKRIFVVLLCVLSISMGIFAQGTKDRASGVESATAEARGDLVLWSPLPEKAVQAFADAFKAHYPNIKVSIIHAGSGELLTRLNSEQPRPSGDVMIGWARESYGGIRDMFEEYTPVEGSKYGVMSSMGLQTLIVNTDVLGPDERPTKWLDLADPKYKGRIIIANPALSGSAYAQIYEMYDMYGDDFLRKVAKNAIFTASSTAVPQSVARGEYAIGVTGEGNVASFMEQGAPVIPVYPSEGTGERKDISVIIKKGPNPENAKLFMEFLCSAEAYTIQSTVNNYRTDSPDFPPPKNLPELKDIPLVPYDADEATAIRDDLINRFTDMMNY